MKKSLLSPLRFLYTLALLLAFTTRCASAGIPDSIQSGDLVFRDGGEMISEIIKSVDNSGYSHVGMIYRTPSGIRVIHATPAEHPHGGDVVIMDSLDFFQAHAKQRKLYYYQVSASPQQRASALRYALNQLGVPFGFSKDKLYCTQLVYQAWQQAGVNILSGKKQAIPVLSQTIILPANIARSANVRQVIPSVAPAPQNPLALSQK